MTLQSTPPETSCVHRIAASRLAASRQAALCGEDGLEAVFRRAVAAGEVNGCDSIDQWLEAIIEGEAEDLIAASGWHPCRARQRCRRAGRCLHSPRQG